jgi:transglutaminase-like putative cysteine protease
VKDSLSNGDARNSMSLFRSSEDVSRKVAKAQRRAKKRRESAAFGCGTEAVNDREGEATAESRSTMDIPTRARLGGSLALPWGFKTGRGRWILMAIACAIAGTAAVEPAVAAEPRSRTFEFTYTAVVQNVPVHAREVSLWLPRPTSDDHQQIDNLKIVSSYATGMATEQEYGNRILSLKVPRPSQPEISVEMAFRVTRREHRVDIGSEATRRGARNANESEPAARWLQRDRLVPIDGKVRELAAEVTRGSGNDLEKARAIYNYAASTLKYDKTGTGWGRGDVLYACDEKRGNCTDFHAVFVGFCRAQGIPARFQIGFSIPADKTAGEIAGYHCWAEFYTREHGWVPVDASEGSKNPAQRDYFFGAHDAHRVQFSQGRDIRLNPSQAGEPLNYFINPYVEIDGRVHGDVERKFSFRDVEPAELRNR